MRTYIQKDIEGYVIKTDDTDLKIGMSYEDFKNGSFVQITEDQELYLKDNPDVDPKDLINVCTYDGKDVTYYVTVSPMTIDIAKKIKINEINDYDSSTAVNEFTYQGKPMWFDKVKRACISYSMNVEKQAGETATTLCDNDNISYTVPIDDALQMFAALEIYAKQCYNVTAQHKADVMALETVEDVENYNFESGYPEKLAF